jgi:hypothetical protein
VQVQSQLEKAKVITAVTDPFDTKLLDQENTFMLRLALHASGNLSGMTVIGGYE